MQPECTQEVTQFYSSCWYVLKKHYLGQLEQLGGGQELEQELVMVTVQGEAPGR